MESFGSGPRTRRNLGVPGSEIQGPGLGAEVQILVESDFQMRSRLHLALEFLLRQDPNRLGPGGGFGVRIERDDDLELVKSPASLGMQKDWKFDAIEIVVAGEVLEAVADLQVGARERLICDSLDHRQFGELGLVPRQLLNQNRQRRIAHWLSVATQMAA